MMLHIELIFRIMNLRLKKIQGKKVFRFICF